MSNTLLPCPFCGNMGSFWSTDQCQTLYATCIFCGARTVDCDTPEEVIAAWNSRAGNDTNVTTNNAVPVVRGEWKWGREFSSYPRVPFIGDAYYCSNCEGEAYWDADYGQQLFGFCPNCGAKMGGEL